MEPTELVTITAAARLLGVHANTIRRRVKRGTYPTEWASSPNGPVQLIPKAALTAETAVSPSPTPFPPKIDGHELVSLQATVRAYEASLAAKDETIAALKETINLLRSNHLPWYKRLLGLT